MKLGYPFFMYSWDLTGREALLGSTKPWNGLQYDLHVYMHD